ncbi:MAG: hypothetical protein M3282_06340 [Gemmatimonadota bacterium]|nr:hypothetical protein [Gemmatimonadota bacterium]
MRDRVEPALTRRQWKKVREGAELWDPTTAHIDVALANAKLPDGDPRKFSRIQAVNLRAAAVCFETGLLPGPETRSQLVAVLLATAAAVEAILPPPTRPQRETGSIGPRGKA